MCLSLPTGLVREGGLVLIRPLGTHIKWSHTVPLELLSNGGAEGGSCCTSFSWAELEGQGDSITVLMQGMLSYPVAYHLIDTFASFLTYKLSLYPSALST